MIDVSHIIVNIQMMTMISALTKPTLLFHAFACRVDPGRPYDLNLGIQRGTLLQYSSYAAPKV